MFVAFTLLVWDVFYYLISYYLPSGLPFSHRSHGWADWLSRSQHRKQQPEKWRWGKSWTRGYHMTYFSVFPNSNFKKVLWVYIIGDCYMNLQNISAFAIFAEAPSWQLDQGEEEEEANEGQQCTQSPPNRLRSLHERQAGAATGRTSRRALSRDNKDVGQRVEQTAPWGEAGQWRGFRQDYTLSIQLWGKV